MVDVTIAILSHNHQDTVTKAIESVLSQKLTYSYKLLLFDDASTDNTPEILKKYGAQYPDKIELYLFNQNEGAVLRAKQIYENSKSKYLCWLDADDYWTYEYKLQKQIDFLEQNHDYVGCFHDAKIVSNIDVNNVNEDELAKKQTHQKYKYYSQFNHYEPDFYPYHLLMRNIIPTASLVFRLLDFNDFFNRYHFPAYSFSWAFQLYIIRDSKFHFINECWSVYFDHTKGISKKVPYTEFTLNNVRILKWYKKDSYYKKFKNKIFLSIAHEYEILAYKNSKIDLKFGYLMLWYYFKAWKCMVWWYKLGLIKQLLKK
ncbi:MAG: glycosyltransferase family 2 protein [Bacteroidales bacterium]